jgi:MFS family permease
MADTQAAGRLAPAVPEADAPSLSRRYFTLGLLTLIYGLNFLDRTIFNVLIEPIKREFHLSDTMMGLLAGFGFVLIYSAVGIPIARFADRHERRSLVAAALAVWSAMTVLCGLAQNAAVLAVARIGVGFGESAGTPASQSMVSDLFDKAQRPRALGIYALGTYLGVFLGYFIGGWINHFYGWRVAFFVAGLPGIALAILLRFAVAEPRRGGLEAAAAARREPLGATLRFLVSQKCFVLTMLGFWATSYTNYATSIWIPPFLARVHHLTSAEIGTYAGTFKGLFGIAGTLIGGVVSTRLARRDDRWALWAPAIMSGLAGPVFALCMLTDHFAVMIAALALTSLLVGFHLGPIFATAQSVAKPAMRAFASAIVVLTATCVGQGLGGLIVGLLNDALAPTLGPAAVRYSLLSAALATSLGALIFVWAARSIRADIARAAR